MENKEKIAPPSKVERIKVDKLLDDERKDLQDQGFDLSGEFVDIEIGKKQGAPMVDPAAGERADAVKSLESVVTKAPVEATKKKSSEQEEQLSLRVQELETELAKRNTHCPRCSWQVDREVKHEPTDDDIASFLESVCSGEPYTKKFELYGGKLVVAFRTRFNCEMDAVREYICNEAQGVLGDDVMILADDLVFLTSIESLTMGGKTKPLGKLRDWLKQRKEKQSAGEDTETVKQYLQEQLADVPTHIRNAVRDKYIEFSAIVEHLMAKSTDPKYWQGASTSA